MTPISADEFRDLMLAGGLIENKKVSEPVNTMFTTFENPFKHMEELVYAIPRVFLLQAGATSV